MVGGRWIGRGIDGHPPGRSLPRSPLPGRDRGRIFPKSSPGGPGFLLRLLKGSVPWRIPPIPPSQSGLNQFQVEGLTRPLEVHHGHQPAVSVLVHGLHKDCFHAHQVGCELLGPGPPRLALIREVDTVEAYFYRLLVAENSDGVAVRNINGFGLEDGVASATARTRSVCMKYGGFLPGHEGQCGIVGFGKQKPFNKK